MNSSPGIRSRGFIEMALSPLLLLILLYGLYTVLRVFFGVFTYAIIFSVSMAGLFLIAFIALPFIYIISIYNLGNFPVVILPII
jgi:hypothetical protein